MQKLHLVGFTKDHEGLILSARRGARSGSYLLAIDGALEEAVDDLRARRAEEREEDSAQAEAPRRPRVESALSVREIQARLRQGRSVADVARAAGVDAEWVERFAPPVLAERAQVITRVLGAPLRRARLGPSALPIGEAVRHHLADRGVAMTADELADAWSARQVAEGRWAVRCSFRYRGRDQTLRFDLDESTGEVTSADRLSGQLGYVTPPPRPAPKPERPRVATDDAEERPTAKRAVVSTGFRPDPVVQPVSRSAKERVRAAAAMRKAAAKRAIEGERAAARKLKERREEEARRRKAEVAAAAKAARAERAAEVAARKAAAEKAKADKARVAERAAARRHAATSRAAAAKSASKAATRSTPKAASKATSKAAPKKSAKATITTTATPAKAAPKRATTAKAGSTATAKATKAARSTKAAKRVAAAPPVTKAVKRSAAVPSRATSTRPAPSAPSARAASTPRPAPAAGPPASRAERPTPTPSPATPTPSPAPATPTRTPRASASRPDPAVRPAPRPTGPDRWTPPIPSLRPTPARATDGGLEPSPDIRVFRPEPAAEGRGEAGRISGAAASVYGTESTRALFRRGLVEQASGDVPAARPPAPAPNGDRPAAAPPTRPRRTRPLRAT